MERVLYTSPHVPVEWIEAHGMQPVRGIPAQAPDTGPMSMRAGTCPWIMSVANRILTQTDSAGAILTTACDQSRRMADRLGDCCGKPLFLMNVPATWQSPASRALYAEEVKRLGRFLTSIGGCWRGKEALREALIRQDGARQAIRDAASSLEPKKGTIPVAVIGGPLIEGQKLLFNWIAELGGQVVLDGTDNGPRGLAAPLACLPSVRSAFDDMVDAYWMIPDIFKRPNAGFYKWLIRETRNVRGIALIRQLWCDLWHAEVARIKDAVPIPVVDLDLPDDRLSPRLRTRLEAFMESIR